MRKFDYYPFGMMMPGRTYQAGSSSYRYSINGQEKTPEIAPNTTTAEFWQYDARIGRRWNIDPKPNVSLSVYSVFANNPIYQIDVNGDTLGVANNTSSRNDINSIVSSKYHGFIDYNNRDNSLALKKSITLDGKEITLEKAILKDEGLRLLNDMVTDTKNYFYSASNLRSQDIIDMSTNTVAASQKNVDISLRYPSGTRMDPSIPSVGNPTGTSYYETFSNLSFTVRGDEPNIGGVKYQGVPNKTFNINSYTRKYDGVVTISPGEFYQQRTVNGQTVLTKIRDKVIFHELQENYLRVNGAQYQQAHDEAINMFKSPYPSGKPTPQRQFESGANQTQMYGDTYYFIMK